MDVIVVGAGVVGLAAAFELARAGHDVRVISAEVPGARQSVGRSRIFRLAHADAALTDAAAEALGLWAEWEALAGAPLLDRTGLLLTGDMSDREAHLARYGGLESRTGAVHPLATARDAWLFERSGAAIRCEETLRLLQRDLDVTLDQVATVDRDGVTLAGGARLQAERVLVCAGTDTCALLGLPAPERRRSARFSFPLRDPLEAPAPCWIQRDDRLSEPFYAIMDGPDHYSVGLSAGGPTEIPEQLHVRDAHRRTVEIIKRVFPGLHPVAERVIACEYPLASQPGNGGVGDDGWDVHERDGVVGLSGPALFKFAPLLGRITAQRVTDHSSA
jgi:sarcosine oxidase